MLVRVTVVDDDLDISKYIPYMLILLCSIMYKIVMKGHDYA